MAPDDVEAYLASVPDFARPTLEALRELIRSAAPEAEERLSYTIPTFFHHGGLVAYHAAKAHCGFHLMSPSALEAFRDELGAWVTTKATVRLPYGEPLPADLIARIVRLRIAQNEARRKGV